MLEMHKLESKIFGVQIHFQFMFMLTVYAQSVSVLAIWAKSPAFHADHSRSDIDFCYSWRDHGCCCGIRSHRVTKEMSLMLLHSFSLFYPCSTCMIP
jgi:hypothetical protein